MTVPIISFLVMFTALITGGEGSCRGKSLEIVFPVENARKISPEGPCPSQPTFASPTVARFASRQSKPLFWRVAIPHTD